MEKKGKSELAKLDKDLTISNIVSESEAGISKMKDQLIQIKYQIRKHRQNINKDSWRGYDYIEQDIKSVQILDEQSKKAERQIQIYYTLKLYKENKFKTIQEFIQDKNFSNIISYNKLYSLLTKSEKSIKLMTVIDNNLSESIYDFIDKFKTNESVAKGLIQELISNYGHLSLIDFNIFFKMCLRRDLGDMYGLSVSELIRLLAIYEDRKQEAIEEHNETYK